MKFNWGTGIALFYATFVIAMVLMVIKSSQIGVELVQNNYYDKDIHYEAFRQKRENGTQMEQQVKVSVLTSEKQLIFSFPASQQKAKGKLTFYRPSNHFQDLTFPILLDDQAKMTLPTENIPSGFWRIQMDWEANEKAYFKEESITL